jgi:hypothetical protein
MTSSGLSAYERWTWKRCCGQILSLKHRLGYDKQMWMLGFKLLDDGRILDPFHGVEHFNPAVAVPATAIPSRYSAVPEMYCILSTYARATEVRFAGEQLSLSAIHPPGRWELSGEDCAFLLRYAEQDLAALQKVGVPFFGAKLERGDLAFEVWPLPRVPIRLVLWRGDAETGHGGTLLFDASVTHCLPGLEIELAGLMVWRLQNILTPEIKWGYHQLGGESAV